MKTLNKFLVGGAVRDKMLGLPVNDFDWVVVGSTTKQMEDLGFTQVGADFPVFLDDAGAEHALARTERSTGKGYNDFSVDFGTDVTLEEDLSRRDFTANAMAEDADGKLVDPFNGMKDLEDKVLRHVSPAFSEDPVRVLRGARFAARFGFDVAPETMLLMKEMVEKGMLDSLVAERVVLELTKVLNMPNPTKFFEVLDECGALKVVFPELHTLKGQTQPEAHHPEGDAWVHTLLVLQEACNHTTDVEVRFAALVHDLGKGLTKKEDLPKHLGHEGAGVAVVRAMGKRLKLPATWTRLGEMTSRSHLKVHRFDEMNPKTLVKWFKADDAFRRPDRFRKMVEASVCDANGRGPTKEKVSFAKVDFVMSVVKAAQKVDTKSLAEKGFTGKAFGDKVHQEMVANVKRFLKR